MAIPQSIQQKLSDPLWKQIANPAELDKMFQELGVPSSDPFAEFYQTFDGTFTSRTVGYELLILSAILSDTRDIRNLHAFPQRYLVITSMIAHAVLIYDYETGYVYDVDFEGSDLELIEGKLQPRWNSWWDFAQEYFSER